MGCALCKERRRRDLPGKCVHCSGRMTREALRAIVESWDSVNVGMGQRFHMRTDLIDNARAALRAPEGR